MRYAVGVPYLYLFEYLLQDVVRLFEAFIQNRHYPFLAFNQGVQLAIHHVKPAVCPAVKHPVEHRHHASVLPSILSSRRFQASVLALNVSTISRAAFAVRSSMILFTSPSALSLALAVDTRRRRTTATRHRMPTQGGLLSVCESARRLALELRPAWRRTTAGRDLRVFSKCVLCSRIRPALMVPYFFVVGCPRRVCRDTPAIRDLFRTQAASHGRCRDARAPEPE